MESELQCIRCGGPISVVAGSPIEVPICARCSAETPQSEPRAGSEGETVGEIFLLRAYRPADPMLTRSMLLPIPGMPQRPAGDLIGRRYPRRRLGSLRRIDSLTMCQPNSERCLHDFLVKSQHRSFAIDDIVLPGTRS